MSAFPCGKSQLHIELPSVASSSRIARNAIAEGIGGLSSRERNNLKLLISELVRGPSNGGDGSIVLDAWKVFSGVRVEGRADGIASISDVMSIRLFDRLASQWHVGDGFGWFFLQTSTPLLEADDVTLFECLAAGDHRAVDVLLHRYREFAIAITQAFKGAGVTHDDVEQVAMIGLAKAIVRFDPDRGFKFTTFAAPTIRGELKKWLRNSAWAVHVPRGLQELALHARRAFTEVSQSIGHEASIEERCRRCRSSPKRRCLLHFHSKRCSPSELTRKSPRCLSNPSHALRTWHGPRLNERISHGRSRSFLTENVAFSTCDSSKT